MNSGNVTEVTKILLTGDQLLSILKPVNQKPLSEEPHALKIDATADTDWDDDWDAIDCCTDPDCADCNPERYDEDSTTGN